MTLTLKVLIGIVIILIAALTAVTGTRASEEPQLVHINLTDNQLRVSQFVVAAGRPVKFEVANEGLIPHRLVIRPMADSNSSAGDEPVIGAHTVWTIEQTLSPGIYRIYCELMNHAEKGMVSAIAAENTPRAAYAFPTNGFISLLVFILGCVYIIGDGLGFRLTRQ